METQECHTCDKQIPSQSFDLHSIHCARNIFRCQHCNKPIQKSEKQSHEEQYHIPKICATCNQQFDPELIGLHECPNAPKKCKFCEAEFPFDHYNDHLYQCGSRTESCTRCGKYIPIRDFQHHFEQVDCLGTFKEVQTQRTIDDIRTEVVLRRMSENFEDPVEIKEEEIDQEVAKKYAEELDRQYAEEMYQKMLMEENRPERPDVPHQSRMTQEDYIHEFEEFSSHENQLRNFQNIQSTDNLDYLGTNIQPNFFRQEYHSEYRSTGSDPVEHHEVFEERNYQNPRRTGDMGSSVNIDFDPNLDLTEEDKSISEAILKSLQDK